MTSEGEFFRSVVPEDAIQEHDFDTSVAHPARIWNAFLGGKDNISQVIRHDPHNGRTLAVRTRHGIYSNKRWLAVR